MTITAGRILDGNAALAGGDWESAREAFSAALEAQESGAAWEGLGWAAWWLSDEALTLRSRESAYRAYRAEGEDAAAGRVAAWLSTDFREFRGEDAVARGWLVRAHRLLGAGDVASGRRDGARLLGVSARRQHRAGRQCTGK